jgi:8-hydroxy-5-deazaflavin:NADPH oxidoreductase
MRIGSGMIGETLARHLVKLGHDVKLANSRAVEGVAAIATDVATAATANDAARSEPTSLPFAHPPSSERLPTAPA